MLEMQVYIFSSQRVIRLCKMSQYKAFTTLRYSAVLTIAEGTALSVDQVVAIGNARAKRNLEWSILFISLICYEELPVGQQHHWLFQPNYPTTVTVIQLFRYWLLALLIASASEPSVTLLCFPGRMMHMLLQKGGSHKEYPRLCSGQMNTMSEVLVCGMFSNFWQQNTSKHSLHKQQSLKF